LRFRVAVALGALAWAFAATAVAQAPTQEEESERDREDAEEPEDEAPPVRADSARLPDRPVMLRIGGSHTWDSNLFRSPDARSDRIAVAYAGLNVDKAYAQQRLRLDVTETAYRYAEFSHLDFEALNYFGRWNWQFGPRIGGALTASREESLADYSEFRNPGQLNVRTTENFLASGDAWLFGGWHLTGGLSQSRNHYTVPFPQEGSYRAAGAEAGVRWVAPSENWLTLNYRSLDGHYVDRPLDPVAFLDDGFRRREIEALASWRLTAKSTVDGRAAWIDYRSDNFAERDFSGLAARLRYLWNMTVKLSLGLLYGREVEPWSANYASYRVDNRVTFAPVWQPTARTTLRLNATRAEVDFRGPLPTYPGPLRHDVQTSLQLEAEWRALRNLTLKAGGQRYRQSSNDPAGTFRGSQFTLDLSFLF
jgi:exopolysaccharide biosynthesis operon protein EpsL